MSTLKVWCPRCCGVGEYLNEDRSSYVLCPDCTDGYITREAIELPDGRAVVVDAKAWEAVQRIEADMVAGHKYLARPSDGSLYRVEGFAIAILAALFTGGVYEAEAVGRLEQAYISEEEGLIEATLNDGAKPFPNKVIESGDLIAIGLKEVGRGKA